MPDKKVALAKNERKASLKARLKELKAKPVRTPQETKEAIDLILDFLIINN